MLSLQSTQQLLRELGNHHLSLYMGNRLGYLLMLLWEVTVGDLLLLTLYSTSRQLVQEAKDHLKRAYEYQKHYFE